MHRMKNLKRHNLIPARTLCAALRAGRGESPAPVRRRRFSDRSLALTVYTYVLAFAAVIVSLAYGLVTST